MYRLLRPWAVLSVRFTRLLVESGDPLDGGGPAKRLAVGSELRFEDGNGAGAHELQIAEVVIKVEADAIDILIDSPVSQLRADVLGATHDRVAEQVIVYRTLGVQAFLG